VILDAGNGLGLNQTCDAVSNPILTINGIPPNSEHDLFIDGLDCVSVLPLDQVNGLELINDCCKQCIGCKEIEELTARAAKLETDILDLRNFTNTLSHILSAAM
jgi:hypothetical protein